MPGRQLQRQALGNADDAHLAGRIVRRVDKSLSPLARRGIDQAAAVLLHHILRRFATAEPDAGGVDRQYLLEVRFRHGVEAIDRDHACVLNRNIDPAKALKRLLVKLLHRLFIGDVHLQREDLAAVLPF